MPSHAMSRLVLAIANVILGCVAVLASIGIYGELTSRSVHDNSESVRIGLGESAHPVLAVLIVVGGVVLAALLAGSAITLWLRRMAWRRISIAWIALVVVVQVSLLARSSEGLGIGYDLLAKLFFIATGYAIVTAVVLRARRT